MAENRLKSMIFELFFETTMAKLSIEFFTILYKLFTQFEYVLILNELCNF